MDFVYFIGKLAHPIYLGLIIYVGVTVKRMRGTQSAEIAILGTFLACAALDRLLPDFYNMILVNIVLYLLAGMVIGALFRKLKKS